LSFNECAVANDKVVSASKEARSAHVEISKMKVQVEGGQERTAPKLRQSFHEVTRALVYVYIQQELRAWAFPTVWSSPSPSLVFLIPRRLTVFGEWARLSSMLVLYSTYRALDEKMKSHVIAGHAYFDRRYYEFPLRTWEPQLTFFLGSSHG
jgi:hypothetical protein